MLCKKLFLNQCAQIEETEGDEDEDHKAQNKTKKALCLGLAISSLSLYGGGIFEELLLALLVYLPEIVVVAHKWLCEYLTKIVKKIVWHSI